MLLMWEKFGSKVLQLCRQEKLLKWLSLHCDLLYTYHKVDHFCLFGTWMLLLHTRCFSLDSATSSEEMTLLFHLCIDLQSGLLHKILLP